MEVLSCGTKENSSEVLARSPRFTFENWRSASITPLSVVASLLLFGFLQNARADDQIRAVRLSNVVGSVQLVNGPDSQFSQAYPNMPLMQGSTLKTGEEWSGRNSVRGRQRCPADAEQLGYVECALTEHRRNQYRTRSAHRPYLCPDDRNGKCAIRRAFWPERSDLSGTG